MSDREQMSCRDRLSVLWKWLAPLLLVVVAVGLYWPVTGLPLLSQDYVEVELAARPPLQYFTNSAYIEPCFYYRPMWRVFDYLLDLFHAGGGFDSDAVRATHIASILIHAFAALLLYAILFRWTKRNTTAALLGALAFVCHPALTSTVAWISARWALYTGTVFLAALLYWDLILVRFEKTKDNIFVLLFLLLVGAALILCVPLVSETGIIGMGALGLWILWRLFLMWRAGTLPIPRVLICCVLLASTVFVYFYLRWRAVQTLFGGINDVSHIPLWQRPGLWLVGLEQDFNILLGAFAIPWLDVETARDQRSMVAIGASGLITAALLIAPFFSARVRHFFKENALPLILLLVFLLFQTRALWMFVKPPLGQVGYYRGYAYVFPVIALGLLVGLVHMGLATSGLKKAVRVCVTAALMLWVLCCALHTTASLNLWTDAGRLFRFQCELLTPWLRSLPPETRVHMTGFDDYLTHPWCQQAFVWDWTHKQILSQLAGKPLNVTATTSDDPKQEPDEFFDGWIIRPLTEEKIPTWERVKPASMN